MFKFRRIMSIFILALFVWGVASQLNRAMAATTIKLLQPGVVSLILWEEISESESEEEEG